jgi:hypothetical protein
MVHVVEFTTTYAIGQNILEVLLISYFNIEEKNDLKDTKNN